MRPCREVQAETQVGQRKTSIVISAHADRPPSHFRTVRQLFQLQITSQDILWMLESTTLQRGSRRCSCSPATGSNAACRPPLRCGGTTRAIRVLMHPHTAYPSSFFQMVSFRTSIKNKYGSLYCVMSADRLLSGIRYSGRSQLVLRDWPGFRPKCPTSHNIHLDPGS